MDIQEKNKVKNENKKRGVVYAITSGKGGVGKTTTTANIGTGLAKEGKSVVVVDADIGLRNLDVVMGLENRIVYDIVDVIEGRAKLNQAVIKDRKLKGSLALLPAAQTRSKDAVSPEQMRDIVLKLAESYDFVIVDAPAGIERGFHNAVAGADEIIVVTNPEVSAVRDADRIIGIVESLEKKSPRLIINRIKKDMVKRGEMLSTEDVLSLLEIELLGLIPEDENVVVASNKGEPIIHNDRSSAGEAYKHIVRRILGEDVPMELTGKRGYVMKNVLGFFAKLKGGEKADA